MTARCISSRPLGVGVPLVEWCPIDRGRPADRAFRAAMLEPHLPLVGSVSRLADGSDLFSRQRLFHERLWVCLGLFPCSRCRPWLVRGLACPPLSTQPGGLP
jgi:hypothetical protein